MAKLIVSMMVSIDGCIEGPDPEDGSWVRIDDELHRHVNRVTNGADALVYGRKAYEVMIPYWPDAAKDPSRPAHEVEFGRIWVEKPKVVFSTTLAETRWNTRVVADGMAEEVTRLKRESPGYLLCHGGAQVVSTLNEHGLVDEYHLFVNPSALGGGVPLFRRRTDLELLETRAFGIGTVLLRYAAARR